MPTYPKSPTHRARSCLARWLAFVIALSCLVIACRPKKELSYEEQLDIAVPKFGFRPPAATGPTVPVPNSGVFVLFYRDQLALDTAKGLAFHSNPLLRAEAGVGMAVLPLAPGIDGADAKYKRKAGDPYIVPLGNLVTTELDRGEARRAMILGVDPAPPPRLWKEVQATLTQVGVTELYRVVRTKDGKLAAERID